MVKHLTLWNIPIKLGQRKTGVEMAYNYFYEHHLFFNLQSKYNIKFNNYLVKDLNKNLLNNLKDYQKIIKHKIKDEDLNIFIGGDHSISIASISHKQYTNDDIIIWIDAHTDCNTFKTSNTQNIHGMPVAGLLGLLGKDYNNFKCIKPNNIVYYGVRSIDDGEKKLIKDNNINTFDINYIRSNKNHLLELENFIKNKNIHISFDVDALDEKIITSTGTIEKNGLNLQEVNNLFKMISNYNVKSIDIVEFNPYIGHPALSCRNLNKIFCNFLKKLN